MQHDHQDPNATPDVPSNLPTDRRALLASIGGLAAGAFIAGKANAGPLNPPAGPVEGTYKTLDEVEPRTPVNAITTPGDGDSVFRIKLPGSYYLTGGVTGQPGLHGIKITSSGVTLDLGGFTVQGVPGSIMGILVEGGVGRVCIRNGYIAEWDSTGVYGIGSGKSITLSGVIVTDCKFNGFLLPDLCTVSDCQVRGTTNAGGVGIAVNSHSIVDRCVVQAVAGVGIRVFNGSTISGSMANNCGGIGILTNANSIVRECSTYESGDDGILIGEGCSAVRCVSGSNSGSGINSFSGLVEGCTATYNAKNGILSSLSNLSGNYTEGNAMSGIAVDLGCLVRDNQCAGNVMAGILATDSDNRIEGNNCRMGGRGIHVQGLGNIIIRNTCSGSAVNWDIAAGNKCLVISGINAGAISGNSGGVSLGSTDPNANYTY